MHAATNDPEATAPGARRRASRARTAVTRMAAAGMPLALLVIAGCSGGGDPTAAATIDAAPAPAASTVAAAASTAAPAATATPTTAAAIPTTSPGETAGTTAQTVSASNATIPELTAAFDAAGISNAARWAREVDECRDADDRNMDKLRGNLAKYNPGAGVVDAIVAALSLP